MTPAGRVGREGRLGRGAAPRIEDLIPIAVVITAGCESCTGSMVRRALRNGSARLEIERTLRIVAHLRSSDCFLQAVGVELAARMDGPLAAGANALNEPDPQAEPGQCCGPAGVSQPRDSV